LSQIAKAQLQRQSGNNFATSRLRLYGSPFRAIVESPVVEARRGIGMVGAEPLFADRQGALKERPRAGEIALGSQGDMGYVFPCG
jgi:hypothetical protein